MEPWPCEVFDAHQHYGSVVDSMGGLPSESSVAGGLQAAELDQLELDTRIAILDARGVDRTVMIASHVYLRPEGLADTMRINDGLVAYAELAPERFAATVGVVEPLYGPAGLAEIDRCGELGMVGVSFHGRFQGVSHDSPWVHRYVERLGERGMIPFVHAPAESPEEALWKAEALGHDFPDLTMVVLDAFSGFEQCRLAIGVAERCENLIFDTGLAFDFHFVLPVVRRCGAHRVVYGSDLYSWPSPAFADGALAQIFASELDDAAKAAIAGGNLSRLLGERQPVGQ